MRYIIEFEDEYSMNEGGMKYHQCKQVPYWSVSHGIIKNLTPYTEPDRKAIEDEVWEFGKKCLKMDGNDFYEIFGSCDALCLTNFSYQEAKDEYEAWKKSKEEIRVGDEVEYPPNKAKGIVIKCHVPDVYAEVDKYAVFTGTSVEYLPIEWLTKTGRVFPEVAELLKKMREE